MGTRLPVGTVTFLFTDIEGSTELLRRFRSRYGDVRAEHERVITEDVKAYNGHVVDTQGDAFFAVFDRATDAAEAALAILRAFEQLDIGDDARLRVRIGIHTAEPDLHDAGYYTGIGVHRAARICHAAHGGQILLSDASAGIIADQELEGVELRDLGEFRLKDMTRPQRLYELAPAGQGGPAPVSAESAWFGGIRTIVGIDVRGFGKLLRRIGDDHAADVARTFQTTVRHAAASAGGWTFDAVADTAFSAFHHARQGIEGAVDIRDALRSETWPDPDFAVGIAVHTGRLVAEHQGGASVWHCAQLVDIAEPWQILVSHATHALLEGEILAGIELRDLGPRDFPRLETSHHIYELVTR